MREVLVFLIFCYSSFLAAELEPFERDFYRLITELRCIQCEGQSLAESAAPVAVSLRHQIRSMLVEGQSPAEIKSYLTQRYGEQILMVPKSSNHRLMLWGLPLVLLSIAILLLYRYKIFSWSRELHH